MREHILPLLLALLAVPSVFVFSTPAEAGVQAYAFHNRASTTNGDIRGTGLRIHWLADPGLLMGSDWYLRPGAELSYGRYHGGFIDRHYWEGTALTRAEYRGESLGFYLQGGLGRLQMSGELRDTSGFRVIEESDTITHAEMGIMLRGGVRMNLGLRYQRYRDSGISFRGIVLGLGF